MPNQLRSTSHPNLAQVEKNSNSNGNMLKMNQSMNDLLEDLGDYEIENTLLQGPPKEEKKPKFHKAFLESRIEDIQDKYLDYMEVKKQFKRLKEARKALVSHIWLFKGNKKFDPDAEHFAHHHVCISSLSLSLSFSLYVH